VTGLAPPTVQPFTELRAFCAHVLAPLGRRVPEPLHPQLHLVDDLGFDSLELYQFQVVLEELCGHELPDDLLAQIDRLGTAFEWYQVKAGQGDRSGAAVTPPPPTGSPGQVRMATRRVRLRPVAPPDYEWLYDLTTRDEHLVRWRDRGQTFRIEEWIDRLWAGVAAQFVATRPDGTPIGLVSLYHHEARNRHARLAVIFDDATSSPGWRLEAVGLLLDYAFEVFDLLKVYAEVIEFNLDAFSSGLDDLYVEEGRLFDYEYAHGRHWPVHILAISRARFDAYRDQWLPRTLGPGTRSPSPTPLHPVDR
jgi:RimJ/RimL family protein N-acetyltransferase/acyl carrier protein